MPIDKLLPEVVLLDLLDDLSYGLCKAINRNRFKLSNFTKYEDALEHMRRSQSQIVVLSSRVENISVLEMVSLIRKINGYSDTPIVILINAGENEGNYNSIKGDIVSILKRPIDSTSVIETINFMLNSFDVRIPNAEISYGSIRINLLTCQAFIDGRPIHLSNLEFELLTVFVQKPGLKHTRETLMEKVWGKNDDGHSPRKVDVHINKLRSRLKEYSGDEVIRTIRALGYYIE